MFFNAFSIYASDNYSILLKTVWTESTNVLYNPFIKRVALKGRNFCRDLSVNLSSAWKNSL